MRNLEASRIFFVFLAGAIAAGCGFREASHPPLPQLDKGSGSVLVAPKLVYITFADDPLAAELDAFMGALGKSRYWRATTSEYGVGPATAIPVRVADAAPKAIDESELKAWLAARIDHAGWPAHDANTAYAVFYPAGTVVTVGQSASCGFGRDHGSFALKDGREVPFAVIPRCQFGGYVDLDWTTLAASATLVETALNPLRATRPAYQGPDGAQSGYAWTYVSDTGEAAELCNIDTGSVIRDPELNTLVQRSWSNEAAAQGHDPCVPHVSSDLYFGAAPVLDDNFTLYFQDGHIEQSAGLRIPVGTRRTVDVHLFSDGPTPAFDIWAEEIPNLAVRDDAPHLSFTFDKTRGQNGDTLKLNIIALDGTERGFRYAVIYAQLGDVQRRWPIMITN